MSVVILKYQNNFADNFSEIAYGQIIKNASNRQFYFENDLSKRKSFEYKMSNFNVDIKYISTNQVNSITEKSYLFSRKLIKSDKISKEIQKKYSKDKIINIPLFRIDDIDLITEPIKSDFGFKNTDFAVDFDILDEINSTNSIGLYINKNDIDSLDIEYINNSARRLNKYLKKPVLYIFSNKKLNLDEFNLPIEYKRLNLVDWREEFYFLTQCKNKIILPNANSYSNGLWASILNKNTYLTTYSKNSDVKKSPENWLKI